MGYEKKLAIQMMLEKHGIDFDRWRWSMRSHNDDFIEEMVDFYEYCLEVKPARGPKSFSSN